ncbi:MAG: hypothetical protein Q7S60_04750 [bacterium]|nr:hypothetical protein [bacterium]
MSARSKLLLIPLLVLLIGAFLLGSRFSQGGNQAFAAGSPEKFEYLSAQTSNQCGAQPTTIESYADTERLQGSCCSAMDLHKYQEQVEGLKKYSRISQIPKDPYDIPASLAKELLGYRDNIQLDSGEQAVYDEAVALSDEGGPCCCRCWRWYTFEGLAKYLITEKGFTADQVAEVWDLEDGCGGAKSEHG